MQRIQIGSLSVSRFIIGGNTFSGFSHQGTDRDAAMKRYFSVKRIKETLRQAERAGVNAHISRSDHHVMRYLLEYWDEGGSITWMAQTCPELGTVERGIDNAVSGGAKACHIHGGVMDWMLANHETDKLPAAIKRIRDAGLAAGIAGHNPKVFEWADKHLDVDYYMCSYYNSAHRDKRAEHVSGMAEWFLEEDRRIMTEVIRRLSKPVIHYKILAAGRNDPKEAFGYAAAHMRPQDAVCVGVFPKDRLDMVAEDVRLLEEGLAQSSALHDPRV